MAWHSLQDAIRRTRARRRPHDRRGRRPPEPCALALHEKFGCRSIGLHGVGRKFDRFWDSLGLSVDFGPTERGDGVYEREPERPGRTTLPIAFYTGRPKSNGRTFRGLTQFGPTTSAATPQVVDSKDAERCPSGLRSTLGKRSGSATPSRSDVAQRTRDQRLNLPNV